MQKDITINCKNIVNLPPLNEVVDSLSLKLGGWELKYQFKETNV